MVLLGLSSGRTVRQKRIYKISSRAIKLTSFGHIHQVKSTKIISFSSTFTSFKTSVTMYGVSREKFYLNKRIQTLMKLHLNVNQMHSQGNLLQAMAIHTMTLVKPRRYWSSLQKMELLKTTRSTLVISDHQTPSLKNSMASFLLNLSTGKSVE